MSDTDTSRKVTGRVDYLEFVVRDLPRAKRFYTEAFRWTFTDYGPGYAAFSDGHLDGGFTTEGEVRHGGALVILYSHALEETLAAVRAAGATISKEIFSFPGGRRFHFVDTEGHELAVWSEK